MPYNYDNRSYDECLQEACKLVEDELRDLRITGVQLEYSDGVNILGLMGSATTSDLFKAIKKLQEKIK
jgi:hypothetical protein